MLRAQLLLYKKITIFFDTNWKLLSTKWYCTYMFTWQVYLWYPLSIVAGGTTAKIMVAAKDNFLGKYIYKDTIARNLAAVIYKVCLFLLSVKIIICASKLVIFKNMLLLLLTLL